MVLARNKSNQELLKYLNISEEEAIKYKPTSSLVFIKYKQKYLIAYNKWRNQWEFPAGKIEGNETLRQCAKREVFEETNQTVEDIEFKGLFKIYDHNKEETRFRMAYFKEVYKIDDFIENEEINSIMLWDLTKEIGYFDEVDLEMFNLCTQEIGKKEE